jgi:hypothetical protein
MESHRTPKRRLSRVPVFTVLACSLVAVAFAHMNVAGRYDYFRFCGYKYSGYVDTSPFGDGEGPWIGGPRERPDDYSYHYYFRHGWPTPFGEHEERWTYDADPPGNVVEAGPPLLRRMIPSRWTAFRMDSAKAAICDVFLSLVLITATGVVALRLERRAWARWQFSIADLFSLMATTSMVLGLICLDARLSVGGESAAETVYARLRDLPLFDRVMTLFAIACAVWLIVSTVADRLGDKYTKKPS